MAESATATQPQAGQKRKRTGKQRQEAKKAAIQAKLDAEAEAAAAPANSKAEEVPEQAPAEESAENKDTPKEEKKGVDYEAIAKRIPSAFKTLHPTFKQSKTFEVRRLVKKIKFLRGKDNAKSEVADLEAQLALLSHIPLNPVIQSHLLLKLAKHPLLKHTPLPSEITSQLTTEDTPSSSATPALKSKVENRLCSSKLVSEGVKSALSWLVGEQGAKLVRPGKGKPQASGQAKGNKGRPEESESEVEDENEIPEMTVHSAGEESDVEEEADAAGWESGSVSGIDSGSESDVVSEASDSSSSVAVPTKKAKKSAKESSPAAVKEKSKKQTKDKETKSAQLDKPPLPGKAVTSSTFLPSLSVGYTLGDSDSDPDLDPDVDGAGVVGRKGTERKNRRGQRARQAIWEKKYGKNAKHVLKAREEDKEKEKEQERIKRFGPSDSGWGSGSGRGARGGRGGAVGARGGRGGFAGHGAGRDSAPSFNAGTGPSAPLSAKPAVARGGSGGASLHPSWEAARLRKQKEAAQAAAPKATKITFD